MYRYTRTLPPSPTMATTTTITTTRQRAWTATQTMVLRSEGQAGTRNDERARDSSAVSSPSSLYGREGDDRARGLRRVVSQDPVMFISSFSYLLMFIYMYGQHHHYTKKNSIKDSYMPRCAMALTCKLGKCTVCVEYV